MKELLISVTHFFRDPEAFAQLEQQLIPRLFESKAPEDQVRIWVSGCATGEEAYSIAMLLAEQAASRLDQPLVQVFATDLDENAIATARDGLYSDNEVSDIPEARLARFFHREAAGYRVRRELRELILFAHHNLVKDPPFSHLDLVSCRNLLIYLNRAAQDRVIETFHFALRPGGYLMLGPSESPDGSSNLFVPVDRSSHLYQSRMVSSRVVLPELSGATPRRRANGRTAGRGTIRAARRTPSAPRGICRAISGRDRGSHHRPHVAAGGPLPSDQRRRADTGPEPADPPGAAHRSPHRPLSERQAADRRRSQERPGDARRQRASGRSGGSAGAARRRSGARFLPRALQRSRGGRGSASRPAAARLRLDTCRHTARGRTDAPQRRSSG